MNKILLGIGMAAAMVVFAAAEAIGLIGERAFEFGFYGLLAASVVTLGGGGCAVLAR